MNTKTIGIIDSGLGGYTIYNALRKVYPETSFTLIVDQKNNPFGNKTIDELRVIVDHLMAGLQNKDVGDVIIACNTISANLLSYLKESYPEITFHDVIDLTVASLSSKLKTILILATQSTTDSHAYQDAITRIYPSAWVDELAAPHLVDLIEGLADDEDMDEMIKDLLHSRDNVDAVIMGCTHFPIVSDNIKKFTKAEIITSIEPIISRVKDIQQPQGDSHVHTTHDPSRMARQIKELFNCDEDVQKIDLEEAYENSYRE